MRSRAERGTLGPMEPGAAHDICRRCGAACCQGPLVVELAPDEVRRLLDHAPTARIRGRPDGGGRLRVTEHPGDRCPWLDPATSSCRAYADRPARCRAFPERQTDGCALSERSSEA